MFTTPMMTAVQESQVVGGALSRSLGGEEASAQRDT